MVWTDVDGGSRDGVNWAIFPSHLTLSLTFSLPLCLYSFNIWNYYFDSISSIFLPLTLIILIVSSRIHDF